MTANAMTRASLTKIEDLFQKAKSQYDKGVDDLDALGKLSEACLALLSSTASRKRGFYTRNDAQGNITKVYDIFSVGKKLSRPIRSDLWGMDLKQFASSWAAFSTSMPRGCLEAKSEQADELLYMASMSFACVYDLLKPASRKTPGTFLEMLIGSVLGNLTGMARGKQVKIPGRSYTVPTDIVFEAQGVNAGLVVPTKITTRERIVQAWTQQRLLEAIFGAGSYKTILVCVSETQREKTKKVNDICVPNQVELFQEYVSELQGLYYLDVPLAYANAKFTESSFVKPLKVATIADLLGGDLRDLL